MKLLIHKEGCNFRNYIIFTMNDKLKKHLKEVENFIVKTQRNRGFQNKAGKKGIKFFIFFIQGYSC